MYHDAGSAAIAFIETEIFTRRIVSLHLESGLRALQLELMAHPTTGVLDPGTGGLRKIRMPDAVRGKGKRGGARVHYLYLPRHDVIYLLYVYAKRDTDVLTADQKRALRVMSAALAAEWDGHDA
jgi:hypothetical protein